MPLSITRFNAQPSHHPNHLITFVKPLPGPDSALAETYLHAVAAICLPIMKKHHLSVTTLEEHEPNKEFIGRNFNNGEIIQLVLKNRGGGWVPFRHVQMVMMHELAHNVQMNHGKNFWVERNKFSAELKELWAKDYTGDGLWGRGRTTDLQTIESNSMMPTEELAPEALCGGTYRSRRRKRKRGSATQDLTWKEKRDRRIEKKFGKNGVALGEDEGARTMLEIGKTVSGSKPRVANSKRGRELRAAAALARFSQQPKAEEEDMKKQDQDSEEEDYEDDPAMKGEEARDINGQRLLDGMGFGMVKVCDDEDDEDVHVKEEMAELEGLRNKSSKSSKTPRASSRSTTTTAASPATPPVPATVPPPKQPSAPKSLWDIPQYQGSPSPEPDPETHPPPRTSRTTSTNTKSSPSPAPPPTETTCPICTLIQPSQHVTCTACSHVLDRRRDTRSWSCSCSRDVAEGERYVNAGDVGVCGLCGERRGGE